MNNILVADILQLIKDESPFTIMVGGRKIAQGGFGEYSIREDHWKRVDDVFCIFLKYGNMQVEQISVCVAPPEYGGVSYIRIQIK